MQSPLTSTPPCKPKPSNTSKAIRPSKAISPGTTPRPARGRACSWFTTGPAWAIIPRCGCRKLAELGYVAFAADIYGKGVHAASPQQAGALAGKFKNDQKLMRDRVNAALDVLRGSPLCDPKRVAAIGYCFGGTCVLELARSGADVAGVVSFHGGLSTANPADAKNIRGKVLVLHGADDPHVTPKEVEAFEEEMRNAGVDWQFVAYGGAVHAFTDPSAGNDNSKGAAYNAAADRRSWDAMKVFFAEIFK